jgi:hypothetical protein
VQHQRLAGEHAHHAAGETDVAAQAHHHVGLDATHHLQRLPEGAQQAQRQQGERDHALAAHAAKGDGFQREAARRHEPAFHAGRRAQPVHAPAQFAQGFGHGQAGEDVATGATGHHEGAGLAFHERPPFIIWRFS